MDGSLLPATEDAFMSGKKIGTVAFADKGLVPMDTELGTELDGRLYKDLSRYPNEIRLRRRSRFTSAVGIEASA
jgi:hypothetical protein